MDKYDLLKKKLNAICEYVSSVNYEEEYVNSFLFRFRNGPVSRFSTN